MAFLLVNEELRSYQSSSSTEITKKGHQNCKGDELRVRLHFRFSISTRFAYSLDRFSSIDEGRRWEKKEKWIACERERGGELL